MGWNIDLPPAEWYTHETPSHKLEAVINEAFAQKELAIDTETTGLNVVKDIPLYWSLSWGHRRMAMPASTLHRFAPCFADPRKEWIFANAKFDVHMLANVGVHFKGQLHDIQVMHALLYEEQPHGLKHIAKSLLSWGWRDFFDTFEPLKLLADIKEGDDEDEPDPLAEALSPPGKARKKPAKYRKEAIGEMLQRFERENLEALVEYSSNDAYGTMQARIKLKAQLESERTWSLYPDRYPNMWELFRKTEVPFTRVLWKCERNGMLIDTDYIEKIRKPVQDGIAQIERDIAGIMGRVINLNSRDLLAEYFFDEKKYATTKLTKGGKTGVKKRALDAAVLEELAVFDPVAKKLLEHRDLSKLNGTYIVGLSKHLDVNNRIHCRLNQDVARCMPAGELVLTDKGYVPVEQVAVGDRVITHTGKPQKVVECSTHEPTRIYRTTLSNGLVLRTTGNHEYRSGDSWVRADRLTLGQAITVHSDKERWLPIPLWSPFEISSWGRVRNSTTGAIRMLQEKNEWGHLKVTLYRNCAQARGEDKKDFAVHRLVLAAFGGQPEDPSLETRHLNGIAWDNTIENLMYGTSSENRQDSLKHVGASFREACVVDVVRESPQITYGLTVEGDHSHVTGGIVTHNTGRLSSSNPNCFHPDTELLTPAGWVKISAYKGGEQVAQWAETGAISFVHPTAFIVQHAEKLVHLENQHTRLAVTPDHRCLLRHRRTRELRVFPAIDYPEDWQQLHAGFYAGGSTPLGVALVQLLVATQADGHFAEGGGIDFGFTKARKVQRLIELLTLLGSPYSYNPKDARGRARIYLGRCALTDILRERLGDKKEFGAWILQLPEEELEAFCQETSFWDGSWTRQNTYSSDNVINATWVQTAFALRGKRAHFREYIKANGGVNYQVDTIDKDYSLTTNIDRQVLPYSGKVYCVSVPSSYVLVRYRGEIMVTGQCQNIPKPDSDKYKIRAAFIAPPGHDLVVLDYDQLEMRLLAAAAQEPAMSAFFKSGKDIHMCNAELVFGDIYQRKYGRALTYDDMVHAKKQKKTDPDNLTDWDRQCLFARDAIKSVCYGLNYGLKEKKLGVQIGVSTEEALEIINAYLDTYPTVKNFYASSIEACRVSLKAFTLLGRRRFLPEIAGSNTYARWQAERQAVNVVIQGCLPASTRILTQSGGYVPIGEAPPTGRAWTGDSWAPYRRLARGPCELAELTFDNGQVLRCDTRHQVLVLSAGAYLFKAYDALEPYDLVCFALAKELEYGDAPLAESEDFYWMGYSTGNGCSSNGTHTNALAITFGNRRGRYTKESKSEEFIDYFRRTTGKDTQAPRVFDHKITVTGETPQLRLLWTRLGYAWGTTARTKRVPASVWTSPLADRKAFLRGLLDADGSLQSASPNLHLCQRELLAEVQLLFRTVGVETSLRGPYRNGNGEFTSWRLDLVGSQSANALGYGGCGATRIPNMPVSDEVLGALAELPITRRSHSTLRARVRKGGQIGAYTARELFRAAERPHPPLYAVHALLSKRALGVTEETYTLSVDHPLHRFDSEGVISKNTAADAVRLAMNELDEAQLDYHYGAEMLLQVHDELIFQVPKGESKECLGEIREYMEHPFHTDLDVELTAGGGIGPNWSAAK